MADRGKCPESKWIYLLFDTLCTEKYGPVVGSCVFDKAIAIVEAYCEEAGGEYAMCKKASGAASSVIAICTPFMQRVHSNVHTAADVLYVDATGNLDRSNAHLVNLFIGSPMGGMPVGMLVVEKEDEASICAALALYKKLCPKSAFHSAGAPQVVMTDDSNPLRNALCSAYPEAVLLLCAFHIGQAVWRWITSNAHLEKDRRQQLMKLFTTILHSQNEDEYRLNLNDMEESMDYRMSPAFQSYIREYSHDRASEWAIFRHPGIRTRGSRTNNIDLRLTGYAGAGIIP